MIALPTIGDVEQIVAGSIAVLIGVLVVAAAAVAFRVSERERTAVPAAPAPAIPPGVGDVLAVLRSSAVVLDSSDAVVRASPAAYAMGIIRAGALAPAALLTMAREVRRSGEIREAELELPRGPRGDERVSVAARVAPLGAELVLVLVEDRTESRRVDAVRRDFVANVSHELKTPVGALSLLAEAVLGAADDPDAVRRFAGRMQYEAQRLSNLVQELIDLSRLQGADPLEEPATVDVDSVVVDAVDHCRLAAQSKGIALVMSGEEDVQVLGDESQLVTALRNLIDNAISYSPERTRIAVAVQVVDDVVEVSVADQGIGIPDDDLERIFERFYRVDPARSRATGGTGLGLSIVKHITVNHGGEVSVWSVEGAGSTFTMRLPIARSAQMPARKAAS
ncbi:MAG: ATP-binding protein [Actinomycetota bacterium]|nr:ATP-binding protein [Actinomycetota bacterium]